MSQLKGPGRDDSRWMVTTRKYTPGALGASFYTTDSVVFWHTKEDAVADAAEKLEIAKRHNDRVAVWVSQIVQRSLA